MVRKRASRHDWLEAGLAILTEQGAPALTIDQLLSRMHLTKGSFYHHFEGITEYKRALLAHFEAESTTRFIELVEQEPAAPRAKLERLVDVVLAHSRSSDPEVAVRAWALQDPDAREAQKRIDRTRLGYVRSLWRQHSGDEAEAKLVALLVYLVAVGADQVVPAIRPGQLRDLYEMILGMLPESTRA
jgi:AcrR family transcriptional regulator